MPVIAAVVGAIVTGLTYWMIWGNGLEHIDHWLRSGRDAKRRAEAMQTAASAPMRAIKETRDGAVALMALVAGDRGELTAEQLDAIRAEMRDVLGYDGDLEQRLIVARHAVKSATSPENAVSDLRDLMQENLTRAEFNDLLTMLRKVAALHGGPTEGQDRIIAFADRQLRRQA